MQFPEPNGRSVLIVEDNADSAEAFRVLFDFWGYEVRVVTTPPDALAALHVERPDAIVLDLGLPTVRDGCELLARVRALSGGADILLIAVTGFAMATDRRLAIAAGCDFFFSKPADLDELKGALDAIDAHRAWVAAGRQQ